MQYKNTAFRQSISKYVVEAKRHFRIAKKEKGGDHASD